MSGPKTNRYTLTPEQRQAMEDRMTIRSCRASLQEELAALNECARYLEDHAKRIDAQVLPEVQQEIAAVQMLLKEEIPAAGEALHPFSEKTQQQLRRTVKLTAVLAEKREELEAQVDQSIKQDIAAGFSATLDDALAARIPTAEDYAQRLRAVISGAVTTQTEKEAHQALEQLGTVASAAFLQNFAAITVIPLENRCRAEKVQYEAEKADYALLLRRYAAACQQLAVPAEPHPWYPGAMAELEMLTTGLEQQALACEEQAYIRRALDEVMVDMGYALLGERDVKKRSGARFHHVLYDFGDGTAVDVSYDANGQIAMELGGLDSADRIPTAGESMALCRSMEAFCTSFEEVEKRLAAKGVVLRNRIAMLPPSEEHAQIINVEDYQLTGEAKLFDASRSAGVREQKKQYRDGE